MRVITFATLLAVLAASAAALDPFAGARGSLGSERDPEDGPRRVESLPGFEGPLPSQHHAGCALLLCTAAAACFIRIASGRLQQGPPGTAL